MSRTLTPLLAATLWCILSGAALAEEGDEQKPPDGEFKAFYAIKGQIFHRNKEGNWEHKQSIIVETVWDGDVIAEFITWDPPWPFRGDPDNGPTLKLYSRKADQVMEITLDSKLRYRSQVCGFPRDELLFEIRLYERLKDLPFDRWKDEPREHQAMKKEKVYPRGKVIHRIDPITREIPEKYQKLDYERLFKRAAKEWEEKKQRAAEERKKDEAFQKRWGWLLPSSEW